MSQRFMSVVVFALFLGAITSTALGAGKVLVVQSYHQGYPWVDDIDTGISKALASTGIEVKTFYMDTKRKTGEDWKIESGKEAMAQVESFKPDVVITADDNAQKYFAASLAGKAGAPQVIFCGVNADPADYGFPAANVTGIIERPHFAQTIGLYQKINPAIKNLVMISDDSITSENTVKFCKLQKTPVPITAYEHPTTWEQWQKAVADAGENADAIVMFNYHTVKKSADDAQSMAPKQVMDWTINNSKVPVISLLTFGVQDGALCGIAEDGREHGYLAANLAKQLIGSSKQAGEFPVARTQRGLVMLNLKTAELLKAKVPYAMIKAAKVLIK
ncbi:MAG: ABC transporter substrate-binding protein [Phycisphaeraceae bacterium JB051]